MIDTEFHTIWQRPMYLTYVQPNLTDKIIQDAETVIGYKLPVAYIELLKNQNGGYIRYRLNGSVHTMIYGIGPYYPSITDIDWTEYKEYVSFELDGLIPFDGDGHWHLCFDYRKNRDEPQITLIDTESDTEEIIADNFAAYLSLLRMEVDSEFVILTNESIETNVQKIAEILNIQFEEPDYWAHGYAQYRSLYKDECIWIEPNTVPNGFVREGEERYDALKEFMNGETTRFPEISASYLIISFSSEELQNELLEKLIQHAFNIKPLTALIQ